VSLDSVRTRLDGTQALESLKARLPGGLPAKAAGPELSRLSQAPKLPAKAAKPLLSRLSQAPLDPKAPSQCGRASIVAFVAPDMRQSATKCDNQKPTVAPVPYWSGKDLQQNCDKCDNNPRLETRAGARTHTRAWSQQPGADVVPFVAFVAEPLRLCRCSACRRFVIPGYLAGETVRQHKPKGWPVIITKGEPLPGVCDVGVIHKDEDWPKNALHFCGAYDGPEEPWLEALYLKHEQEKKRKKIGLWTCPIASKERIEK